MSAHRDHVHRYYAGVRHRLLPLITDTVSYVNDAHDAGARILIEGANATMLDIDFGTYPYVTSSNPSIGSVFTVTAHRVCTGWSMRETHVRESLLRPPKCLCDPPSLPPVASTRDLPLLPALPCPYTGPGHLPQEARRRVRHRQGLLHPCW